MTHFMNSVPQGKQRVAMAAPYPGKILPINLAAAGGQLIAQKDAFLCAASGTKLDIVFNRKIGTGLFGGEGFILQSISGDGLAFMHAGGTIIEKQLQGETLRVDTGCIVAFQPSIQYSIERAGNLKSMVFGGEGLFLATLTGVGRVWLQSMPSTARRPGGGQPEARRLPGGGLGHRGHTERVRAPLKLIDRATPQPRPPGQTIGTLNEPSGPKSKRKSSPGATAIGRVNEPDRITCPALSDLPCPA